MPGRLRAIHQEGGQLRSLCKACTCLSQSQLLPRFSNVSPNEVAPRPSLAQSVGSGKRSAWEKTCSFFSHLSVGILQGAEVGTRQTPGEEEPLTGRTDSTPSPWRHAQGLHGTVRDQDKCTFKEYNQGHFQITCSTCLNTSMFKPMGKYIIHKFPCVFRLSGYSVVHILYFFWLND